MFVALSWPDFRSPSRAEPSPAALAPEVCVRRHGLKKSDMAYPLSSPLSPHRTRHATRASVPIFNRSQGLETRKCQQWQRQTARPAWTRLRQPRNRSRNGCWRALFVAGAKSSAITNSPALTASAPARNACPPTPSQPTSAAADFQSASCWSASVTAKGCSAKTVSISSPG
jgi:hypothetical protein